ncbi:cysteine hydrolase family protein [Salinarimonas sp.]|uniref:cysteine hydrolase family protein n=1 Tax=Salinarimonas sp. TaxID=2766526 RepID=UPI00391DE64B
MTATTTIANRPAPRTLLSFAGAPTAPTALEEGCLVLIDMQEEYVSGALPLVGIAAAIAEAGRLLAAARAVGAPIFHVVHHGRAGGALFDPDTPRVRIVEELAPLEGETIVVKSLPNAFTRTGLADLVAATGRRELVIAGCMTHLCVSATARAALDLGLRSTIVADACATRDLPDPAGGIVDAATVHRAGLAALADRFAIVVGDTASLDRARAA